MRISYVLVNVVAVATIAGCGGDGVDDSKKLSELTMEEATDACLEMVADFPSRTVTCSGGFTVTLGFKAEECDGEVPAAATCTATVGDVRACAEAMNALTDTALCADTALPAPCLKLTGC